MFLCNLGCLLTSSWQRCPKCPEPLSCRAPLVKEQRMQRNCIWKFCTFYPGAWTRHGGQKPDNQATPLLQEVTLLRNLLCAALCFLLTCLAHLFLKLGPAQFYMFKCTALFAETSSHITKKYDRQEALGAPPKPQRKARAKIVAKGAHFEYPTLE